MNELPFAKPTRIKSPKYLKWVRTQPCVINGKSADPHHIIGHGYGGTSTKAPDYLTFPLSREEHTRLHHDRLSWENRHGTQWKYVALTMMKAKLRGIL